MTAGAPTPVFDGHNDALLRLWRAGDDAGRSFFEGGAGHLDLPKARVGGFIGGFFALFPPNPSPEALDAVGAADLLGREDFGPVDRRDALDVVLGQAAIVVRMARSRPEAIRIVRSAAELDAALETGALATILHLEGAEPIGDDLAALELLHAAGLRSLGPVWSRSNEYGCGVPFRFPASPDIGPGLTPAGERLVAACEALGIILDLSHMNEAGFWDMARLSQRPLVATHSNAHALCPASRNLTDRQLDAIAERGGIVGLNFATAFLREDGRMEVDTPLDAPVRHLSYLVERLGEHGVALGSDFDGATVPAAMGDAAGLPRLVDAMREAGFGETLIGRICSGNWLDFLRRSLPANG